MSASKVPKPIIGLEAHVQLHTASKLFCGCATRAEEPNSATCEVCLGMPGAKPVLNKKALEYALRLATALNCKINRTFYFSRKTYFYPDMAKNFQITQYEIPVGTNGFVEMPDGRKIRIRRVHLEEDPAALVHEAGIAKSGFSLVDYNRSGVPLAEIVTEPDISSAEEARAFLGQLATILNYIDVFEPGEDTMRVDSNASLEGSERVEVKNITGHKSVETALAYEIKRQQMLMAKGEKIARETRGFDEKTGATKSLRKKETEEDYGYVFEPDLPTFEVSDEMLSRAKAAIPELPKERARRFVKQHGIEEYDADVLCSDLRLSRLFEDAAKVVGAKLAAGFLTRELLAILNRENLTLKTAGVEGREVIALLKMLAGGKVTEKNAKMAMVKYITEKIKPVEWVEKSGLAKDMQAGAVELVVEKVLAANRNAVEDYKKGEPKALNFLVGLIMRETKGKAEPRTVQKMVEERIKK